ncbi:MAG: murein transglycosylase [Rhodospirillales bacterium]|nr:murein transglycosylase [Rhodospirillales bacterium]
MNNPRALIIAGVLALLAACTPREVTPPVPAEPKLEISATTFAALPGWAQDDQSAAYETFRDSCAAMVKRDRTAAWSLGPIGGTNADWIDVCQQLQPKATAAEARAFFERNFTPLSVYDGSKTSARDSGMITGYFEPELKGSRAQSARFSTPLYRRPPDLVTADLGAFRDEFKGKSITGRIEGNRFVPYPPRAIIEKGELAGKKLEILWVDDAIETFFLHVQGSGRVVLENGETVRVGYDAQNGQIYRAIGRDLVERGVMPASEVTLDSIVNWLRANPKDAQELMNKNPSYVFFREIKGRGPIGSQGVPLTPGRSLAVDRKFHSMGMPVWLDTTYPAGNPQAGQPLRRLMIAQDTGGAIVGVVRGDLFWGAGPQARAGAGAMKQQGKFFVLVPTRSLKISQLQNIPSVL